MSVDVLICNLTRLGDLLQTQPLINDLHEAGYSVGLVCQENFASALPLLRNVRQSWTLPGAAFLSALDASWPEALKRLMDFSQKTAREANARFILNLTPTLPARLLSRLLARDAQLLGFGIDEYGYGLNEGVWASFISVAARQRINAPFNISDMLRRLAYPLTGTGKGDYALTEPDEASMGWAEKFIAPLAGEAAAFVAFQPGASAENRRWPISYFQQLGQRLWDKAKIVPILLGSGNEKPLALEYGKEAQHPWLDAMGKTNLREAAALLKKCCLLVSNDTGTMHLASGQNVPILAFFLATAQPWDTAPLRPLSCCLEARMDCHPCSFQAKCSHMSCKTAISPESVEDLVLAWLKSGDWASGLTDRVNKECRVWLTERDSENMSSLRLLNQGEMEERSLWLPHLREFWRHFLDDISNPENTGPGAAEPAPALPAPRDIVEKAAPVLSQASDILDSIYACGGMLQKSPHASKLFLKNCSRLQALLDASPPLSTLAAFWQEFRNNQGNALPSFLPAVKQMSVHVKNFAESLTARREKAAT